MKVISFSIFGDNPLYTEGALQNAALCRVIYPDWQVYFYAGEDVSPSLLESLRNEGAAVIADQKLFADTRKNLAYAPFWRFMANDIPGVEHCIFRDCDSRVGMKERAAVDQWIESGKQFHLIYDHLWHSTEILAGMWGSLGGSIPNMSALIDEFFPADLKAESYKPWSDQAFLSTVIWPRFVTTGNYLAHSTPENSAWHRERGIAITPFPTPDGFFDQARQSYIGQTIPVPGARRKQKDY